MPLSENDYSEAIKKGKKALSGYYEAYKNIWIRNSLTEFKISGVLLDFKNGGKEISLPLRGKLDKIEFLGGDNVNVVDYKTGKQITRNEIEGKTKNADGNYKRQLVFYKLLLDNLGSLSLGKKFNMVSAEIDFIEPDDKGRYKKEKFVISEEEVEDLKKIMIKVAKEILSFEFWDKKCAEKDCEFCKLRRLMN
jgi:DNA helicase-2/ATP-dependent DNA helicase PcrA